MNGKIPNLTDIAVREAMSGKRPAAPQGVAMDPFEVAVRYFGLSALVAQAMGMTLEPCLCGHCSGKRVVFNHGLHAHNVRGPEVIARKASPTEKEPE